MDNSHAMKPMRFLSTFVSVQQKFIHNHVPKIRNHQVSIELNIEDVVFIMPPCEAVPYSDEKQCT